eukprot:6181277-Pleurochrysis_carterae.AAC.1
MARRYQRGPRRFALVAASARRATNEADPTRMLTALTRRELAQPACAAHGRMPLEAILRAAEQLLGEEVVKERSLIEQGFDSLLAQELVALLLEHGYRLRYADVLKGATPQELSCLLSSITAGTSSNNTNAFPCRVSASPDQEEGSNQQLPLVYAQRMWLALDRFGYGAWANISLCLSCPAKRAKPAAIAAALQSLCDEHCALRTCFQVNRNGALTQQIQPASQFALPLSMRASPTSTDDVFRELCSFEDIPFDLTSSAPIRALVLVGSEACGGRHYVCLTCHHVNIDQASIQLLQSQLVDELYAQSRKKNQLAVDKNSRIVDNKPAKLSFAMCVAHQLQATEERNRQLAYWQKRLQGCAALHAPPQLGREEYDIGDYTLTPRVDAVLAARLSALARRLQTTLPLLLHTVFAALVARLRTRNSLRSHAADSDDDVASGGSGDKIGSGSGDSSGSNGGGG